MKQSLSTRCAALFASIVITTVVLESVAELGHPVCSGQALVAMTQCAEVARA